MKKRKRRYVAVTVYVPCGSVDGLNVDPDDYRHTIMVAVRDEYVDPRGIVFGPARTVRR